MEIIAGPSESFFEYLFLKVFIIMFFIKRLGGLHIQILEEIILRVDDIPSCITIDS